MSIYDMTIYERVALHESVSIVDPEDQLQPSDREQDRLDLELFRLIDNGAFDPEREVIEPAD